MASVENQNSKDSKNNLSPDEIRMQKRILDPKGPYSEIRKIEGPGGDEEAPKIAGGPGYLDARSEEVSIQSKHDEMLRSNM